MEKKKDPEVLLKQLQMAILPEDFVEKMKYDSHKYGDILLITGVGKVYPFMRSHNILDNIQHIFSDIPVVMLYPGSYNGQELSFFPSMMTAITIVHSILYKGVYLCVYRIFINRTSTVI